MTRLVPTLRRFARKGFKPAEVALSLDALSRMGGESHGSSTGSFPLPRWAEEVGSFSAETPCNGSSVCFL